jgi:3-isopropylmalate/(R)-2-methylmalate dehydratase small subunit
METVEGVVLVKLGDDVSTDDITSGKYVRSSAPEELAKICLYDIEPDFYEIMKEGGILAAGKNFGCGSSREWAPVALKAAGVRAVVAEEFARIFYRNALNVGLPVVECKGVSDELEKGDYVTIHLASGRISATNKGMELSGIPIPEFLLERVRVGGLANYLMQNL